MTKMVYKYQDYYFEVEDSRKTLGDAYSKFVEDCKKSIQKDRDSNDAKRKELVGNSK